MVKVNKKDLSIFLGILIIGLVFAIQIVDLGGSPSGNITFSGNENHSLNISIPKNANVTSAFMNFSGFGSGSNIESYQENANITSSSVIGELGYIYFNYTKPDGSTNKTKWQIKISNTIQNITLDNDCWNYDSSKVSLRFSSWRSGTNQYTYAHCMNSTGDWHQVATSSGSNIGISHTYSNDFVSRAYDGNWHTDTGYADAQSSWFYVTNTDANDTVLWEEAIIWNITKQFTSNTFISINNTKFWNITGEFSQTNNKTSDFSSILNTAINNGNCDCSDCSIVENNCSIPFLFHSDTAGILEYSDIQINYDDLTPTTITLTSPEDGTQDTDGVIRFLFIPTSVNTINNCSLISQNGVYTTATSISNGEINVIEVVSITDNHPLFNDDLKWSINCTDNFGNTGNSSTFALDTNPNLVFGGGGGGTTQAIISTIKDPKNMDLFYSESWQRKRQSVLEVKVYNLSNNPYQAELVYTDLNIEGINLVSNIYDEEKKIYKLVFDVTDDTELGKYKANIYAKDDKTILAEIEFEVIKYNLLDLDIKIPSIQKDDEEIKILKWLLIGISILALLVIFAFAISQDKGRKK